MAKFLICCVGAVFAAIFLLSTARTEPPPAAETEPTVIEGEEGEYSRSEFLNLALVLDPPLVPYSLPSKFEFPASARDESVFGVDFSHHNESACDCVYDWGKFADQKVRFVYLKASEGRTFQDRSFRRNAEALAAIEELPFGAYHFLATTSEVEAQATNFLNMISNLETDLPPTLDIEWHPGPMTEDCPRDAYIPIRRSDGTVVNKCDRWHKFSPEEIIEKANIWLDIVKKQTGKEPVVYTSAVWWQARVGDRFGMSDLNSSKLWVADYSRRGLAEEDPKSPNDEPWTLWQFTDRASVDVGEKRIGMDANIYPGGLEAFEDEFDLN